MSKFKFRVSLRPSGRHNLFGVNASKRARLGASGSMGNLRENSLSRTLVSIYLALLPIQR